MRATYDKRANAAYISLKDDIAAGEARKTYVCDEAEVGDMINLDFDQLGRLIGIEVLGASAMLPEELLAKAELIG